MTRELELTQSQLLFWTGQKLNPASPLYNMAFTFEIEGPVDHARFQAAFQSVLDRNDGLRTVIDEHGSTPVQRLREPFSYRVEHVDVSNTPDPQAAACDWIQERSRVPFDLEAQLFESALLRLADDRFIWYLNQHHLISDIWSTVLIYRAVAGAYAQKGEAPEAPSYASYLAIEAVGRTTEANQRAVRYWSEKAQHTVEPVAFYGDHVPQPALQNERTRVDLGAERTVHLRNLAEQDPFRTFTTDLTLFNLFSTVLFAYLYRISGNRKVAFGAPAHNRASAAFRNTVGLFIELLPLHVEVEPDDTFVSLYRKVQIESGLFLRHTRPGMSGPEQHRSFNTVLNYINVTFGPFAGHPVQTTAVLSGNGDANHHLRIQVDDLDETGVFTLLFDFNTEVFDAEHRRWACAHFLNLLDALLDDPGQPIRDVDLLTDEERTLLTTHFEVGPRLPIEHTSVPAAFDLQVERDPDALAVVYEDDTLTYGQLAQRAHQLAHHLRTLGVGRGTHVGIFVERSVDLLVGVMGTLKAGAAFVPLDPGHPADRILYTLKDGHVSICLTQTHLIDRLPASDVTVVPVDADEIRRHPTTAPKLNLAPDDLAYVMYTSGSTGLPKGNLIEHRSLLNLVRGLHALIYAHAPDRLNLSMVAPLVFDAGIQQVFCTLLQGHTLHVVPEHDRTDGARLYAYFRAHEIDVADGTPGHIRLLVDGVPDAEASIPAQHFILGGEALTSHLVDRFRTTFGSRPELWNIYGVAECCVDSVAYVVGGDELERSQTLPIGTPMANERVYIVDQHLNRQPIGVVGELCLGGLGVGRGYLNRPDLTATRFVDNPFEPGERLYRTGDLARFRTDGVIEFLGRNDRQVQIRGYRVERGEIEHRLRTFRAASEDGTGVNDISDAIVLDYTDEHGDVYLCAYVVANQPLTIAELRAHLGQTLPAYMIPARFVQVERIPLTINGKVDRSALATHDVERTMLGTEYTPPGTEIEILVTEIWSKVLGVEKIGVHDHFLELGGNSLTAIQIAARLNEAFQLSLPPQSAFLNPTIAALATQIETAILVSELD